MSKFDSRELFLDKVLFELGAVTEITRKQADEISAKYDVPRPHWLFNDPSVRLGRGLYSIKSFSSKSNVTPLKKKVAKVKPVVPQTAVAMVAPSVLSHNAEMSLVPEKASGYVPFGNFVDVRSIVKSRKFYPAYITGLSGNGKTMMIEQVCAQEKRELVRVNITIETDEDDLIGGFRLVNGETVWQDGPVITAMSRGAILLLDEVDLGSNKLMCLQPVLEGKSVYLKKTNRVVQPTTGFNVIATANTKGKGSDDGRYIGTNILNEAFLERFAVTFNQEYPSAKVETKIVQNLMTSYDCLDEPFADNLVKWADAIRKTFDDGGVDETITTRRMTHIVRAYAIFKNQTKAIELCCNRFDAATKTAFIDLYDKIANPQPEVAPAEPTVANPESTEVPF